jgi:polysaccharide biosynthesis protein PelA
LDAIPGILLSMSERAHRSSIMGAGLLSLEWSRRRALSHCVRFLGVICGCFATGSLARSAQFRSWIAFYGATCDAASLANFDLIVLDPGFRPPLDNVMSKGASAIAYLSISELRKSDDLDPERGHLTLLSENPAWPGTHLVDVRDPRWRAHILDFSIPLLLSRGFCGVFLDTADTPGYLENKDPIRFKGARLAAVELIRSIRARFPDVLLVMNRGYDLLSEVIHDIDAVVAESLISTHASSDYHWLGPDAVAEQLAALRPARERVPPLTILSLDYWRADDAVTIGEIYRRERALGNTPYVGTRLLDKIVPEPKL